MSAQHTKGRLKAAGDELRLDSGRYRMATRITACGAGGNMRQDVDAAIANARRLAACWNAFEGIDTDEVEFIVKAGGIAQAQKAAQINADMIVKSEAKLFNATMKLAHSTNLLREAMRGDVSSIDAALCCRINTFLNQQHAEPVESEGGHTD